MLKDSPMYWVGAMACANPARASNWAEHAVATNNISRVNDMFSPGIEICSSEVEAGDDSSDGEAPSCISFSRSIPFSGSVSLLVIDMLSLLFESLGFRICKRRDVR